MFFMPLGASYFSPQGQRGGCGIKKRGGVAAPHSLNSFFSCSLPLLFGFENDDPEKFEETIATPPKRGVPTDPDSGAEWHASIPARRGSLSSVFIPAGRLGKDAPEGALKEGRRTYENGASWTLFPLPWMIPDRSSPSRVRFAAFRALDRSGPIRRRAVYEEKGGWGFGPCPGRKEPFGHTSALSRSGGAKSPVGP